jgi:ABC-type lipoprotein release transport system permease subunit
MGRLLLVVRLAFGSLVAHRIRSLFVGGLLLFGTFLVVTGSALLGSVQSSMEGAITGSLAGHIQVYAEDAPDELEVFGGMDLGSKDIGEIEAFEAISGPLSQLDNVAHVVPMGIVNATVFGRNEIDEVLSQLRDSVAQDDARLQPPLIGRVRRIVGDLAAEADLQAAIVDAELARESSEALRRVGSDAFWAGFQDEPLEALDFLDSKIAPMAADGDLYYLRIIGTDPGKFAEVFDRFYIVDGTAIPEGKRGVLLSKRTYEELIKNKVARELDDIHAQVADGSIIADDPVLQQQISRNVKQYRRITFQLDPDEAMQVEGRLRTLLGDQESDLETMVRGLLDVNDANLAAHFAFFYEEIASRIDLYAVEVGGLVTLRGFTQSGYVRSINVPLYGTYELRGLEKAGLQSAANIADLVTFRELYGKMSDRERAELAAIRAEVGVKHVSRESAEDMLFGGSDDLVEQVVEEDEAQPIEVDLSGIANNSDPWADTYPVEELRNGLVLNAAIVLKDPSRLWETIAEVVAVSDAEGLGLQVVDWQTAAGMTGQFILVMQLVIYITLFIIFLVAMILINNAMVTSTLDRVPEIGTLRAIGAARWLVTSLFLLEALVLGAVAGVLGAGLAVALVSWLGHVGVPAVDDILVLLFAGERLHPTVGVSDVLFGLLTVTAVAGLSAIYPALMAARVPPVVAMQGEQ